MKLCPEYTPEGDGREYRPGLYHWIQRGHRVEAGPLPLVLLRGQVDEVVGVINQVDVNLPGVAGLRTGAGHAMTSQRIDQP